MRLSGTGQGWVITVAFGLGTFLASTALATTVAPTSTTETFGHWTLACADGSSSKVAHVQSCEIFERLSVKGKNGHPHPLLEMALGTPPAASSMHLALRVPLGVALRAGVQLSLDKPGTAPKPQQQLLTLNYLTCTQTGCAAETTKITKALARLKGQPKVYVTFTTLAGARKIAVPVPLDGFDNALAALAAHGK